MENDNNWLFADASGFNFNGIGNAMRSNSDGEKYGSGSAYMTSFDSDGDKNEKLVATMLGTMVPSIVEI